MVPRVVSSAHELNHLERTLQIVARCLKTSARLTSCAVHLWGCGVREVEGRSSNCERNVVERRAGSPDIQGPSGPHVYCSHSKRRDYRRTCILRDGLLRTVSYFSVTGQVVPSDEGGEGCAVHPPDIRTELSACSYNLVIQSYWLFVPPSQRCTMYCMHPGVTTWCRTATAAPRDAAVDCLGDPEHPELDVEGRCGGRCGLKVGDVDGGGEAVS